ncbi:hypothetical protein SAMD00019534_023180, partial [Acytostelium subglobosum LB1]|uniref:hypothetical protein n=1 Tax=Acytostelium subglobosum LB1 TaxID=1410327 RepID=UPI000644DC99
MNTNYMLIATNFKIWQPSDDVWKQCMMLLNDKVEQQRIEQFKRPAPGGVWLTGPANDSAKSSLMGRLLMLLAAQRLIKLPLNQIKFQRDDKGKPYLVATTGTGTSTCYQFNVSHDGDYTVIYARNDCLTSQSIGVDVMKNEVPRGQPVEEFFESLDSSFTKNEWQRIGDNKVPPATRVGRFFTHWCLKESYIKAVGIGLGFNLQSIQFQVDDTQTQSQSQSPRVQYNMLDDHGNVMDNYSLDSQCTFKLIPNSIPQHIIAICHLDQLPDDAKDDQSLQLDQVQPIQLTAESVINELSSLMTL